jgi:hypothetical protein
MIVDILKEAFFYEKSQGIYGLICHFPMTFTVIILLDICICWKTSVVDILKEAFFMKKMDIYG